MITRSEVIAKRKFEQLIRAIIKNEKVESLLLSTVFRDLLRHSLGDANETSMGALLAALQTRGVKNNEIIALFKVILKYDRKPVLCGYNPEKLYGIVGSGKDEFKTYNVSTCAAFVAAAMDVCVVKNGSRSDTSIAGTTDLLESFGYSISFKDYNYDHFLQQTNIAFIDALPHFPLMAQEYVGRVLFINPLAYLLSIASGIKFKNMLDGRFMNKGVKTITDLINNGSG